MTDLQKENVELLKKKGVSGLVKLLEVATRGAIQALPFIKKGVQKLDVGLDRGLKSLDRGLDNLDVKLGDLSETLKETEQVAKEEVKLQQKVVAHTQALDSFCTIDDFAKIKLKVGEIKEAHVVEGADKLYRFLVDIGEEGGHRTILSGIREYFPEKDIFIGKKVCVVANLAPRKLRGFESNGMLLFAGGDTGKLFSVTPDLDAPVGTTIR